MAENLGVFNDFWDTKHPHHLPFLNLNEISEEKEWNLRISLSRLDKIFSTNPREKVINDMELLINEVNWRPHLIFCLSLLKLSETENQKLINQLWSKLKVSRSWVYPQLLVTASIVDKNFTENAKELLELKGSTIDFDRLNKEDLLLELVRNINLNEDKTYIAIKWKDDLIKLIKDGNINTDYNI